MLIINCSILYALGKIALRYCFKVNFIAKIIKY